MVGRIASPPASAISCLKIAIPAPATPKLKAFMKIPILHVSAGGLTQTITFSKQKKSQSPEAYFFINLPSFFRFIFFSIFSFYFLVLFSRFNFSFYFLVFFSRLISSIFSNLPPQIIFFQIRSPHQRFISKFELNVSKIEFGAKKDMRARTLDFLSQVWVCERYAKTISLL